MDQQQFDALRGAGFNRIPVTREILADLDTPLSTYLKLADVPYSFLLESVQGGETWGRYSIIGLPSRVRVTYGAGELRVHSPELNQHRRCADPLAEIEALRQQAHVPAVPGLPRFAGGLVGYLAFDTVRSLEPRLGNGAKPDALGCPDIFLLQADEFVVFDNLRGTLTLVTHADAGDPDGLGYAEQRLGDFAARLRGPLRYPSASGFAGSAAGEFQPGFGRAEFCRAVERAREYIRDGDIFQVVLSQRLSAPFAGSALDVYRALRGLNPSPYMYYFNFGDFQVVGASPEVLVRVEDREVTVRPIAGTRRRGKSAADDAALAEELLADPKERAEHVMLLDLGRNDLGRVAETGSVRITEQMAIERYSHVMHIVSEAKGRLRAGLGPLDALRAAFPAGTVSGAPKVRALEIIDELEPVKRGIYSGAVGYLGWNGNLDMAIAIRTAVVKDGYLHVQAGAGIVHDSVPEREWQETLSKGQALMRAVAMTNGGAL
ncbi:MAG TPA: anthranilate synthase component I [Gammaproteobacteria bacterium]|nr:anthranilate synthase component I [Gammaproteobacteria bacterium]